MLSRIIKNVVQNVNSCPEYNIVFTSFLSVGRRWSTYTSLILRFLLKCLYQANISEKSCICICVCVCVCICVCVCVCVCICVCVCVCVCICVCVWGLDFASFYDLYMGFCNCSDSVIFFFIFISAVAMSTKCRYLM
jgi:hypothetical protein